MSLLDTFVMVFQADAKAAIAQINQLSDANQKVEDSTHDVREALDKQLDSLDKQAAGTGKAKTETIGLRREIDGTANSEKGLADATGQATQQMDKQTSSLSSLAAKAVGFAAASFSVGAILHSAFERADTIRAIEQTADAIGVAIEDVDAFGKAAEAMGGDAQGARDSLTDMAEAMGEALSDKESGRAKAFTALGISIKDANGQAKNGLTGILDLATAVEGLSKSEAIFKIKELGITDNRTVEMVLKGRKELERLLATQKEQGVVTKESAENARRLTEAFGSLKNGVMNAGNGFIDSIIPALTRVIEWLSKGVAWMSEHKDFVIGFFGAIGAVILGIYAPAMWAAATATIAATWPLIAIGAAIAAAAAAFALIYDDVMNFVEGNDSFIGQVSEKYPIVGQIVHGLIDTFAALWETLVTGAQQIGQFVYAGFMQVVNGIKAAVDFMGEAYARFQEFTQSVADLFWGMGEAIKAIFQGIIESVQGALSFASKGIDKFKSGISGVASFFGLDGEDGDSGGSGSNGAAGAPGVDAAMGAASSYLGAAASAPTNSITSNAITNSTNKRSENNVQFGDINVQTQATDAQGTANATRDTLADQMRNMEYESATGVDR